MILYAAAGATGLAIGHVAFPRFLRRFIKFRFVRMLQEDERERRRDLTHEHGYYLADDSPPVGVVTERPPPPPPPRLPEASETLEESKWQQSKRHKREYEMLRKEVEFWKASLEVSNEILESLRTPPSVLATEPEVVEIHEFGSKDPVAFIRVADGAQIEQMICNACHGSKIEGGIVARKQTPGGITYRDPYNEPPCKACGGRGKFNVTRF